MNKKQIKKTLTGVSVAGLIAGMSLLPLGCAKKAQGSCGKGSCGSKSNTQQGQSSCGKGSCGKGSCGK